MTATAGDSPGGVPSGSTVDRLVEFVLRHGTVHTRTCSRQRGDDGYTLNPRRVADHNFIHSRSGELVWVMDGEPVSLPPGRLLLVPPGLPHRGYSRTAAFDLVSIHVELTLPGGRDAFSLLRPAWTRDVAEDSPLGRYLDGAAGELRRSLADQRLFLPPWASLITTQFLREEAAAGRLEAAGSLNPLVARLLEELTRRIHQPTKLEDLVIRTGFSAQHLTRVFREELGITPLQYLTRLRLERAAADLHDGRLTVRAVAERAGYEDPYYFSRLFKQHMGRSPQQYRDELEDSGTESGE